VTITAKRLEELGACQSQIDAFRALWGDGPAPMTVETALEHAQTFEWEWAADKLLTDAARAEYERARAAAWAEAARAEAAEFERATAPALAEYLRARASAWDEYDRAKDAAWAEFERAKARAFAEAYIKQEAAS
jgi:hypothetical protein